MRYGNRPHKTWLIADDAQRASRRINDVVKVILFGASLFVIVYGLMGGFAW